MNRLIFLIAVSVLHAGSGLKIGEPAGTVDLVCCSNDVCCS